MPIYEFECRSCGEKFEKLCSMNVDVDAVECPACQSKGAERLLSTFYSSVASSEPAPCGASGGSCATGQCPFAN